MYKYMYITKLSKPSLASCPHHLKSMNKSEFIFNEHRWQPEVGSINNSRSHANHCCFSLSQDHAQSHGEQVQLPDPGRQDRGADLHRHRGPHPVQEDPGAVLGALPVSRPARFLTPGLVRSSNSQLKSLSHMCRGHWAAACQACSRTMSLFCAPGIAAIPQKAAIASPFCLGLVRRGRQTLPLSSALISRQEKRRNNKVCGR